MLLLLEISFAWQHHRCRDVSPKCAFAEQIPQLSDRPLLIEYFYQYTKMGWDIQQISILSTPVATFTNMD